MRIVCPDSKLSRRERVSEMLFCIETWSCSSAMKNLIELFGGDIASEMPLEEYVHWLNEFVEIWNYRSRLQLKKEESERWNVFDDKFVLDHSDEIMNCVSELGLVQETCPVITPDYILPLGGARYSNLDRPAYAYKIYKNMGSGSAKKDVHIVALSGTRLISDKERAAVDSYAPEAKTEFDAICKGLEIAFQLDGGYEQTGHADDNINLCSIIRNYGYRNRNTKIASLAAPSSDPSRRANSRDTFEYFLKSYNIKTGNNVLLVTSQIYAPYQLLKFVDLAIEGNFDVDCIGYSMAEKETLAKPSNFLQEVKATVNAMDMFVSKYNLNV